MIRKRRLILASASRRRSQILSSCGIRHSRVISGAREKRLSSITCADDIIKIAEVKARKVATRYKDAVVIGADTLVRRGGRFIGKPRDKSQARRFLQDFSGKRLEVFTGLCVIDTLSGRSSSGYEKSLIYTKEISPEKIEQYLKALAPYDKAGGFSIEGAGSLVFDNIRGSYFNILGLPMAKLEVLLKKTGLDLLDFIK